MGEQCDVARQHGSTHVNTCMEHLSVVQMAMLNIVEIIQLIRFSKRSQSGILDKFRHSFWVYLVTI